MKSYIKAFWYSLLAIGTAISVAGAVAEGGPTQQDKLANGLIILMICLVAIFLVQRKARRSSKGKLESGIDGTGEHTIPPHRT